MKLLYRGFDGLDVAFQGLVPDDLLAKLEDAKESAIKEMRAVMLEHRGVGMEVADSGARGGYAFRCDTGPYGATWFFKRPRRNDPWGVRVSVKSLALALYGLGGVRAHLYGFMEALGIEVPPNGESIGRVDYAVDILFPDFVLEPDNFVMHSHANRKDHIEFEPLVIQGASGRVTSVTVGKMPNRQVIVYDKRHEVIQKHKSYWWNIWNQCLASEGKPHLNRHERAGSQVWRVELRAGKDHLLKQWGGKKWRHLDNHYHRLLKNTLSEVRYTLPNADSNRARWPNHPLWNLVGETVNDDLFEMACDLDPVLIKEVIRWEHVNMLEAQITGLAANLAVAAGMDTKDADKVPEMIERALQTTIDKSPKSFMEKMDRANQRYRFLDHIPPAPS